MREVPNAVVIGYGFAGRSFHSYLIGLTPGLRLHGVASRSAETRELIQQERHCRAYESFGAVLADDEVDLVVLASPTHLHAEQAIAALSAGKHVVTDKPMATSLVDAEAMIAAAQASGRVLSVFQNRRWDGDFLTLRHLLGEGALGELRWLEMAWNTFGPPRRWRGQAEKGGGRLFDLGSHMLDQVLLIFPQAVTSVYCRMHHDYPEHDVESHAQLTLGFEGGATAIVDVGGLHALPKPRIAAFGTAGAFVKHGLDPQEAAMKAGDIDSAVEPEGLYGTVSDGQNRRPVPTVPGRWRNYYETVAAQLTARPLPHAPVRLEEARRVLAVLDAAFASARTGQVIRPAIAAL